MKQAQSEVTKIGFCSVLDQQRSRWNQRTPTFFFLTYLLTYFLKCFVLILVFRRLQIVRFQKPHLKSPSVTLI